MSQKKPKQNQIRRVLRWWMMLLVLGAFSQTSNAQSVVIGTGTSTTNGSAADPVERYYNYIHSQIVWTAAELTAAGVPAGANITAMGFSISESAASLSNFEIQMGATSQSIASPMVSTGLTVVKPAFTYVPVVQTAGNFDMITFTTPFFWDGISNIVVNTCTGSNPFTSPYGGLRVTTGLTSGIMRVFRQDGSSNCATFASGTNYTVRPNVRFDYSLPTPCSGTPTPGNTLSSVSNYCSLTPPTTTLTLQNVTTGTGVTYQWEVADDAAFTSNVTALGTATSQTYTLTGTNKYFRCLVTCTSSSLSAYSTPVAVLAAAPPYACYCVPSLQTTTYGCTDGDVIAQVALKQGASTLYSNNSGTGCPGGTTGYSDYTNLGSVVNLTAGNTYGCQVSAGQYGENYAAWIDYNDDGQFTTAERIGYTTSLVAGSGSVGILGSSATFPITLACNPNPGVHRMRVRCAFGQTNGSTIVPCAMTAANYGETEDYLITIDPPLPCPAPSAFASTTPTTTGATFSWTNGCIETSWEIEYGATGFTPGSGTVETVTSNPATISSMTCNTTYDVYLRANCNSNGYSTYVGPIAVTTAICPCTGTPTPGNTLASISTACSGQSISLSTEFATTGSGVTYLWESADDAAFTLNVQTIGTSPTAVATMGSVTTYYRCQVSCVSGPSTGISTPVEVTNSIPTGTTMADPILVGQVPCDGATPYANTVNNGSCFSNSYTGANNQTSADVWYQFTLADDATVNIGLCASGFDTYLHLLDASGVQIVGNDDYGPLCNTSTSSSITYALTAGTYYVVTEGYGSNTGNLAVSMYLSPFSMVNESATACDSYTWAVNGMSYTMSGTYNATAVNTSGCNVPVELALTINNSTSNSTTASGCDTYQWNYNTMIYSASGTYTEMSTNAAGCPHTETLNLTIFTSPVVTAPNVSMCPGSTVVLGGSPAGGFWNLPNPYTGNATSYNYVYVDGNGCSGNATATISPASAVINTVTITNVTGIGATVNYNAVNGIGWYEIRHKQSSSSTWITGTNNFATTKPLINLIPNTSYDVQVRGYCSTTNPGAWTSTYTFTTSNVCGTPVNLTATNIAGSTAKLNWDAVAFAGSGYYTARWKPVTGTTWSSGTSSSTNKSIAGLTPNTNYEYQLRTNCGSSASPYSPSAFFTTAASKEITLPTEAIQTAVNIYPNPTQDELNIDFGMEVNTVVTVKVMDMSGRIVKQIQVNAEIGNNTVTMNLGDLTNGVYTIQLIGNDKLMNVTRVIKN